MRLLVIGGAGFVGRMVLPHLAGQHELRVFDLTAPPAGSWAHVLGDVTDFAALRDAMEGIDAVVYMAMNTKQEWGQLRSVDSAFDVNVKGVHFALWAAHERGVRHAVVTSSMSVYHPRDRYPDESERPDAQEFYGLTKRLGEEVERNAVRTWGLTITALRLCFPIPDGDEAPLEPPFKARTFTRGRDVAAAILAGLDHRDGFSPFAISGDPDQSMVPTERARSVLGWRPTEEPARR
ncbi:MAG: NAD(P)-dependent oxidoreductase [Candidatus Dormiibacterota bacterium]